MPDEIIHLHGGEPARVVRTVRATGWTLAKGQYEFMAVRIEPINPKEKQRERTTL